MGFVHGVPETEVPKAPAVLSAHRHPPRGLILTPTAAQTYLHRGQGSGLPGLDGVGCSAASPQHPGARQRCAGSAGCHGRVPELGKAAADGSKVSGEQQGGREKENPPAGPPVRARAGPASPGASRRRRD